MDERNSLAQRFEAARDHLHAIAWRILGSRTEAEDAVQESWLRLASVDVATIDNVPGWLTHRRFPHLPRHASRPEIPSRGPSWCRCGSPSPARTTQSAMPRLRTHTNPLKH